MRMYRLAALTVAATLAATALPVLAGPVGSGLLAPALAGQTSAGATLANGTGGPPPPGGGSYSHAVYSQVTISGQPGGSGSQSVNTGQYAGPPCWIEPRFTGANSWHRGDPVALTASGDADEYWWWFGAQEPAFAPNAHYPGAAKLINDSFKKVQGQNGWWWVPAWLTGSAGMACALGLVSSMGLNNGFLRFTPPVRPPDNPNPGEINPEILRYMARAALRLPRIQVTTNPVPARGDVNLPYWVSVAYQGKREPWAQAGVPLPDGTTMWAKVVAHSPHVTVNAPNARLYNHCGATGNRYNGDPTAIPRCGATFLAPSSGGPFTLTVTVQWTVTWTDSTNGNGSFPPALKTRALSMTVREIQAINNG